jgi:periplasmic divalent cation tolerance protein
MSSNCSCSIVLTTVNDARQSEALSGKILEKKLAACVQIQKIKSFYRWQGKVEHNDEYLLLIKTRSGLFAELSAFIKENHSYQTPEIVELPIENGSDEYLGWIRDETS